MTEQSPLERLSTGIPRLDEALGGGLPTRSTTVFAGASGTGKTVLALQTGFHLASEGKRVGYFTTLSEPPSKLLRYMQLYDFFDDEVFQQRISVADLGSTLRSDGAEAGISLLIDRVETSAFDLVVVDSFKAIHDLVDPPGGRHLIYELAVSMAGWGATSILVGEYSMSELRTLPEFSIADGIIQFRSAIDELTLVRELEIHKLRGSAFYSGVHFYDLDASGLTFYPRVSGPSRIDRKADEVPDKVATRVEGLDEQLGGGLPRGSSTVVLGSTGTGKTVLGVTTILKAAQHGEPSILLALEETPAQLRGLAHGLGFDCAELERENLLDLRYSSPVELSPDRFLHGALDAVYRLGAKRVLLDSLTSLELSAISRKRFKELVYSLIKHLRALDATLMMTMEILEGAAGGRATESGISFAADNVIQLARQRKGEKLRRSATIIKARGVSHSESVCELAIGLGGARVMLPERAHGSSEGPGQKPDDHPHD